MSSNTDMNYLGYEGFGDEVVGVDAVLDKLAVSESGFEVMEFDSEGWRAQGFYNVCMGWGVGEGLQGREREVEELDVPRFVSQASENVGSACVSRDEILQVRHEGLVAEGNHEIGVEYQAWAERRSSSSSGRSSGSSSSRRRSNSSSNSGSRRSSSRSSSSTGRSSNRRGRSHAASMATSMDNCAGVVSFHRDSLLRRCWPSSFSSLSRRFTISSLSIIRIVPGSFQAPAGSGDLPRYFFSNLSKLLLRST